MYGATNQGNTLLIKHGIAEDESDYRLHVGFANARAYVFPTEAARVVLSNGHQYERWEASQPGTDLVTGAGYYVPWHDIQGCMEICIPKDTMVHAQLSRRESTSAKGRKAVQVAKELFERGMVHLPFQTKEITSYDLQIKGTDLIIFSRLSIQVKCDYWCAKRGLAIQTHECNPLRRF